MKMNKLNRKEFLKYALIIIPVLGYLGKGIGQEIQKHKADKDPFKQLSKDLSTFHNKPIDQTSKELHSALMGERESLQNLGMKTKIGKRGFKHGFTRKQRAKKLLNRIQAEQKQKWE